MSTPGPTISTRGVRGNPVRNNPLPQNERKDVGRTPAAITIVPQVDAAELKQWLTNLYDVSGITSEDVKSIYDAYSYKGFNREEVLIQLRVAAPDTKLATHIIVAVALRGPQAASTLKLINGKSPIEMGIPASGGQGTKALTLNKIQAATADLAAFYLKKMGVSKRLNLACPGWLQFPSAGSISLPADLRQQHLEFAVKFSEVIGGQFQPQIYDQMVANSYYNESLGLFT
jgi:hypothetical protein